MMKESNDTRRNSLKAQANLLSLMMFLTGVLLGSLLIYGSGFESPVPLGASRDPVHVIRTVLSVGKFLILLFLLSNMRWGAMLIPPVFGLEGMLLGSACAAVFAGTGLHGLAALLMRYAFRLFLVLPYGFLLGTWSVDRSLSREGVSSERVPMILALTLAVIGLAALLEWTIGVRFASIYYSGIGV